VRITVIHNAVDLQLFQPDGLKRSETRRQLGFSEQELIVGTIGQLTPRKGQLELIEAFAGVAQEFPTAKLVVIGAALFNRDFEYEHSLKRTAQQLGIAQRVSFLGQREDVAEVTRALDVAVVNSRAEPFGLTVVEAMAAGVPVLATAVDGIREIIDHDRTGWLVQCDDRHALADGLRNLLADKKLRTELSQNALLSVRARFAADRFMTDFHKLYRLPATKFSASDPAGFALESN
jgi:glycosyltransferase involved in cell wall biosynthesis